MSKNVKNKHATVLILALMVILILTFSIGCFSMMNAATDPDYCAKEWGYKCAQMKAYINAGANMCKPWIERQFRPGGRCSDE